MNVMHQISVSCLSKDNCQNHDFRAWAGMGVCVWGGGRGLGAIVFLFKEITSSVAKRVPLMMIVWPLPCWYAGEIKGLT